MGLGFRFVWLFAPLLALGLASCGSLPYDGPSAHDYKVGSKNKSALFVVLPLDYAATQRIASVPSAPLASLANANSSAPTDLIGVGDALAISIFEAGATNLFAHGSDSGTGGNNQQTLPRSVVDRDGTVQIPFVGPVKVAGLTPVEASEAIKSALRRVAVDPQVTLSVTQSQENAVSILGEIKTSGHFPVSAHNDHLLDVIATAGGPTRPVGDLSVEVVRANQTAEVPLPALLKTSADNIRLAPEDRVLLLYKPRKYTTFGALGHISQVLIEDENLTLASAISRAGGLDTTTANAANVLLFRFERPEVAAALGVKTPATVKGVPIVYRLNMRDPGAFFVADNFDIQAGDMLYVPRSDITEAQKFFGLINTVTQIGYNASLTSTIKLP
jgi:polysaccharide export outer membrane protein